MNRRIAARFVHFCDNKKRQYGVRKVQWCISLEILCGPSFLPAVVVLLCGVVEATLTTDRKS